MRSTLLFSVLLCALVASSLLCARPAEGAKLVISFAYPNDNIKGKEMYVRGTSDVGLSWDKGVKLENPSCDLFSYSANVKAGATGTAEVKALVNDETWQIGSNTLIDLGALKNDSHEYYIIAYPFFYSDGGRYEYIRSVYSPQLDNYRDLVVYLPPSYDENWIKFHSHVVVAHDGQNLFNASTSFLGIAWECDKTIDELVNFGSMEEVVMVGINNTPDRDNELTFDYDPTEKEGGKGDLYLDFIEQTVLPLVHERFRISTHQDSLGILGSSLGGIISCYAGWTRGKTYSKAFCMSSSFWWNSQSFLHTIMPRSAPVPPENMVFYLDSGDQGEGEDDKKETIAVRDSMKKEHGFVLKENLFYYLDEGGEHNEYYWGKRFHIPMTEVYPVEVLVPIPY